MTTFRLHLDMMTHVFEIVEFHLAERIGGTDGYSLLRGCMKNSLMFSYLNGASYYATFCTQLLADHCNSSVQGQTVMLCKTEC